MSSKRRNETVNANNAEAGARDQNGGTEIIGKHSIMLALEPRFMFDAAVADTVAETDSQVQENADAVHGDGGTAEGQGDGGDNVADGEGGDGDVKDPLESFGISLMGVGPQAADPGVVDLTGTDGDKMKFNEDGKMLVDWVDIDCADGDQITVTIKLTGTAGDPTNKIDFDYDPLDFKNTCFWDMTGGGSGVEKNIDRSSDGRTITITGNAKDVNQLLDTLTVTGGKDWFGSDSLEITVKNSGNAEIGKDVIAVTVESVNDVTQIVLPDTDVEIKASEDVPLKINDYIKDPLGGGFSSGLTVVDPDVGDSITVVLEMEKGTLTFDGNWTSVDGNKYTFTGTRDQAQAMLDSLTYTSAKEDYGNYNLKISVYDDKTPVADRADPTTIMIKVSEVNDDPIFEQNKDPDNPTQDPNDFLSMDGVKEGDMTNGVLFTEDMFNLFDVDNENVHLVITIDRQAEYGIIQKKVGNTWVDVLAGESFTYQDVLNNAVRYVHKGAQVRPEGSPFHNKDSFSFSVNDGAGGFLKGPAAGMVEGVDYVKVTTSDGSTKINVNFTINIEAVNQAPTVDGNAGGSITQELYEGQEDVVIKFVVGDPDQLASNDHVIYITDVSQLDGELKWNGVTITQAMIQAAKDADPTGKTLGFVITYSGVKSGMLTFTHDGRDGWHNGSPLDPDHKGATRNTEFSFVVQDDGGGTGTSATTAIKVEITVLPNNDMPEFQISDANGNAVGNGTGPLVTVTDGSGTYVTIGDGTNTAIVGNGGNDHWLTQLDNDLLGGGFNVVDDDSYSKDITYTLTKDADNLKHGEIWVWVKNVGGKDYYTVLKGGESFTQKQIDDGHVFYKAGSSGTLLEDNIKFTVRDGSLTAWIKDPVTGTVSTGVEGSVGSFDASGKWVATVITVKVKVKVEHGPGNWEWNQAPDVEIKAKADSNATIVLEEGSASLAGCLDAWYVEKGTSTEVTGTYGLSDEKTLYRLEVTPQDGELWIMNGNVKVRQIGLYDTFSQEDLANLKYFHNGEEAFQDSFKVSVTDGNLNYRDSNQQDILLEVKLDITPGNDTPNVGGGELKVTEGAEGHQDPTGPENGDGHDRNGSVIGPEHIIINDPDGKYKSPSTGETTNKETGGKNNYESSSSEITFVVQKPGYGDIWVWTGGGNPNNAAIDANGNALGAGWVKLSPGNYADGTYSNVTWGAGGGAVGSGVYIFTQDQLNNGHIRYVHDGRDPGQSTTGKSEYFDPNTGEFYDPYYDGNGNPTGYDPTGVPDGTGETYYRGGSYTDSLVFRVNDGKGFTSDTGHHHSSFADGSLKISIANVNDKPRDVTNKDFHTPENGNRNPAYSEADRNDPSKPGTGTVIGNEYLNYVDAEQNPKSLQYYIKEGPTNGTLYHYNGSAWVIIGAGAKFTQDDVNRGYVKYVHNGVATENHKDSFTWTLRDGDENSAKWVEGKFDIVVDPTNNPPELTVDESEIKNPGDKHSYFTDQDTIPGGAPAELGTGSGKDLGGVFEISDRDYTDPDGNKGIKTDNIEVILSATEMAGSGTNWTNTTTPWGSIVGKTTGLPAGLTVVNNANGTVTITGSLALVNAYLAGDGNIYLKADTVKPDLNAPVYVNAHVNDKANGDVGGTPLYPLETDGGVRVYINTHNTAPTVTTPSGSLTTYEDVGKVRDPGDTTNIGGMPVKDSGGNPLKFSDVDNFDENIEVVLVVGNGTLTFGPSTTNRTSVATGNGYTYTIKGSIDEVNKALAGMRYQPKADWYGADTIKYECTDHFGGKVGDVTGSSSLINITVEPRNDAPDVGAVKDHVIVSPGAEVIGGTVQITVKDTDDTGKITAGDGTNDGAASPYKEVEVTLTVTNKAGSGDNGTLDFSSTAKSAFATAGGTITVNANNEVVLLGTEAAINALLNSLKFTTSETEAEFNLKVVVDDKYNGSQSGTQLGEKNTDVQNITLVQTTGVGGQPGINCGNGIVMNEDMGAKFDGGSGSNSYPKIVVDSQYSGSDNMEVTIELDNTLGSNGGKINLSQLPPGVTVVTSSGGAADPTKGCTKIVLKGTEAAINAALEKLVYNNKTHYNNETDVVDTIKVTVVDKCDYTGSHTYLTSTSTITVKVHAVNDAPTVTGGNDAGKLPVLEDADKDALKPGGNPNVPGDYVNKGNTVDAIFGSHFNDGTDNQTGANSSNANGFAGVLVIGNAATSDQGTWEYWDKTTNSWKAIEVNSTTGLYLGKDVNIRFQPKPDFNGDAGKLTVRLVDDSKVDAVNTVNKPLPGSTGDVPDSTYSGSVTLTGLTVGGISRYSSGTVVVGAEIDAVNDKPEVVSGKDDVYLTVNENNHNNDKGDTVSNLFGPSFSDPNDGPGSSPANSLAGIIVTGKGDETDGKWQYSLDGGNTWLDIDLTGCQPGEGVYIPRYVGGDTSKEVYIRLTPNDPDFNQLTPKGGVSDLEVKLIESKTSGSTQDYTYGSVVPGAKVPVADADNRVTDGSVTLHVDVRPINDAPVIENAGSKNGGGNYEKDMPPIFENTNDTLPGVTGPGQSPADFINPGQKISDLFGGNFADGKDNSNSSGENGFAGVLVVGNNANPATEGKWTYWDTGAKEWKEIPFAGGKGVYLGPDVVIRFEPIPNACGSGGTPVDPGTLVVRLVDDSAVDAKNPQNPALPGGFGSGSVVVITAPTTVGDSTRFSADKIELGVSVNPVNRPPVIGGVSDIPNVDEGVPTLIAPGGALSDPQLSGTDNWGGSTLVIQRGDEHGVPGTPQPEDKFGIKTDGTVGYTPGTGKVTVGGVEVGTVVIGGGKITVTFDPGTTEAQAEEILKHITYEYDRDDVPGGGASGDLYLSYTVNDGNTGDYNTPGGQGYGGNMSGSTGQKLTIINDHDEADPVNDRETVTIGGDTNPADWIVGGNILDNDFHKDYSRESFDPSAVLEVVGVEDGNGTVWPFDTDTDGDLIPDSVTIPGKYGSITVNKDGSYTYVVDPNNSSVQRIVEKGGSLNDTFSYTARDRAVSPLDGSADIVIRITAPKPPAEIVEQPEGSGSGGGNPGGVEDITPPFIPQTPGDPMNAGPSAPAGGFNPLPLPGDNQKPVQVTVEDATNAGQTSLNNNINGLRDQLRDPVLLPPLGRESLYGITQSMEFPTLIGNTDHKVAQIDQVNEFSLPGDLFVHSKQGEMLTFTAFLFDGRPLPEWMTFDPEEFTLACTPPADAEGSIEVIIRAEDRRGLKADASVNIKISEHEEQQGSKMAKKKAVEEEEEEQAQVNAATATTTAARAARAGAVGAGAAAQGEAEGELESEVAEDEVLTDADEAAAAAGGVAGIEIDGDGDGEAVEGVQSEAPVEDVNAGLVFAGEWLQLEAEVAQAEPVVVLDAHPGLRNQIAATGSDCLMVQTQCLVQRLLCE